MRYLKFLQVFLRIHGLLPDVRIQKAGLCDTLRIICLALMPWLVLFTSTAYAIMYFKTSSLENITDVMCTNFICTIVVISNIILAIKKFKIRAIVTEMRKMVEKRNNISQVSVFSSSFVVVVIVELKVSFQSHVTNH